MLKDIIRKLTSIVSPQWMVMMVIVGLIVLLHDGRQLKKMGVPKDYRIARGAGVTYVVLGILIFVIAKMFG